MPLHSLSCVINKLRGGMAALFCNTPCCSAAILKRIRNGGRRPRSLARSQGDHEAGDVEEGFVDAE
jgi:hypothetical protein